MNEAEVGDVMRVVVPNSTGSICSIVRIPSLVGRFGVCCVACTDEMRQLTYVDMCYIRFWVVGHQTYLCRGGGRCGEGSCDDTHSR